jgi:hypothetical protein
VNRFAACLLRCFAILLGYAAASLGASAFLNLIFLGAVFGPQDAPAVASSGSLFFSVPFVALFVAYFGFIPAAAIILIAEVLARRDWLFYALGGGVVAAVFIGFLHQAADPDFQITGVSPALTVIGAGMVGGICYWLTAGRWAGNWQDELGA